MSRRKQKLNFNLRFPTSQAGRLEIWRTVCLAPSKGLERGGDLLKVITLYFVLVIFFVIQDFLAPLIIDILFKTIILTVTGVIIVTIMPRRKKSSLRSWRGCYSNPPHWSTESLPPPAQYIKYSSSSYPVYHV